MGKTFMLCMGISITTAGIIAATLCGIYIPKDENLPPNSLMITENEVDIKHDYETVIRGRLGVLFDEEAQTECMSDDNSVKECYEWPDVAKVEVRREEHNNATCHHFQWSASATDVILQDCYPFDGAHWYGGSAIFNQHWPIDEWDEPMTIYASASIYRGPTWYGSLVERYFVSSKGVGIRLSHSTPLYVSINASGDGQICFRGDYNYYEEPYTTYHNLDNKPPILDYKICTADNIRVAHEFMTKTFMKRATGLPDLRMMKSPVWSTWAKYKKFITTERILDFARNITYYGFNNSQLEIDDGYSGRNFGDIVFDPERIPDPNYLFDELHEMGYRVTLWWTPFANDDTRAFKVGDQARFFVRTSYGETARVQWWNGLNAGLLDVTNPEAVNWMVTRLENARRRYGIDSYKFDAGETQFLGHMYTKEPMAIPCEYTTKWAQLARNLGTFIEVRSSYENQDQPVFLRMMDKDSHWGWDNGIKTLVTTALTYSVLGYSYVLPDMIGGNGYPFFGIFPDPELFVRWLQITAFLSSMQYSYSPWDYDDPEIIDIALRWTSFHENVVTPKMVHIAETEYVPEGKGLIRPVWWIAPDDPETYTLDQEFLVGDDWLVAPITDLGARSRDVYLPAGTWRDEIHNKIYDLSDGGQWLLDVSCQLDEILYFTKL